MTRPRIYCDFNDRLDELTFGLRSRGTAADIKRQRVTLEPGLELTLVDYDALEDGSSAWLVADGVVAATPGVGFVARINPNSFRRERRLEHSARITWSAEQTRKGLSSAHETIDPVWLSEDRAGEGWSLVCDFLSPPSDQGSPTSATVRFLMETAPHDRLRAGARVWMFERATSLCATVDILD